MGKKKGNSTSICKEREKIGLSWGTLKCVDDSASRAYKWVIYSNPR